MADYATAAAAAAASLDTTVAEGVEEYEIRPNSRRVRMGKATDQLAAAFMLEGMAARRSAGGLFRVAKIKDAR